ncbi:MAG TPA: hypothetical protein VGU46_06065 [Acidobacteriaceae bacterium]|nr:hypothetical protein [Acidobacteriaceae bacterium]
MFSCRESTGWLAGAGGHAPAAEAASSVAVAERPEADGSEYLEAKLEVGCSGGVGGVGCGWLELPVRKSGLMAKMPVKSEASLELEGLVVGSLSVLPEKYGGSSLRSE